MRLICPNCGAQYALADDVIPAAGRDVQCSNCAHTWFETPGASSDDLPPEPRRAAPPPAAKVPGPFDGPISDAFNREIDEENLAPAPQAPAGRKAVDPDVADILREEAKRETDQRKKESPAPIESQSDLGLNDPAPQARSAGIAAGTAAVATTNRRELLPDIEEINSSLRPDDARSDSNGPAVQEIEAKKRRGFRRGFFLVLLIIALLVAVYIQAEAIKTAVPTLTDAVNSYVATVDAGRVWLDNTVRSLLNAVSADTSE